VLQILRLLHGTGAISGGQRGMLREATDRHAVLRSSAARRRGIGKLHGSSVRALDTMFALCCPALRDQLRIIAPPRNSRELSCASRRVAPRSRKSVFERDVGVVTSVAGAGDDAAFRRIHRRFAREAARQQPTRRHVESRAWRVTNIGRLK